MVKMKKLRNSKDKIKSGLHLEVRKNSELTSINALQSQYESINSTNISNFNDFPISDKTKRGLKDCGYHKPTDIQKEAIKQALHGKDILGAAHTGSGKTLAFLVPVMERLYVKQWTKLDGVGALIITPTRELAYQIFETLCKVGTYHDFSAGLVIGGKDLKVERTCIDQCNIIICTPGRLLQHMDENPLFDCINMQILVLDEADRCLDMGFEHTMNAIIANLPSKRQTLLFSATQTNSIKDLARLSLKDPCYISVHEFLKFSTPTELLQSFVVVDLKDKVSVLWSFLKNHPNKKIIVFFSSCKQVKYIFEIFSKLRPGTSLMALYGTLHQLRRINIYESFCRKQTAILFATDIAARGLDFPGVNWVVQVDCPESPETYIHRVGRTARFDKGGESLLMLIPSELEMVNQLVQKKIPIQKIDINTAKINNPVRKMEAYLAKDPSLKQSAQRAFISYVKAVFLMKNKTVFNVQSLDTDAYAYSLGLAVPPKIRFLNRMSIKKRTKLNKDIFNQNNDNQITSGKKISKSTHFQHSDSDSDNDNDILVVKRQNHEVDLPTEQEILESRKKENKKALTKVGLAKKILKKNIIPNKKIIFAEDGTTFSQNVQKKSELGIQYELENTAGINIEKAKVILRQEDKYDKQLYKEKVKAKHKITKMKQKKNLQKYSDLDDGSEEDPDISWLPEPDKIYSENNKSKIVLNSTTKSEEPMKKRKRKNKGDDKKQLWSKKEGILDEITSPSLCGNGAEDLALMLLKST